MTACGPAPPLWRAPLDLRALLAEFLDHGRLRSTAAFGFDPRWDPDAAIARGWQPASLDPGPIQQLERDALLRHRGGWRPVTLKPFYLRGAYLSASVAPWRGALPLATVLRWLARHRPAVQVEWFEFEGADQGAALAGGRVGIHFLRRGRRYFVACIEASATAAPDDPDLPGGLDAAHWLRRLMTPCEGLARWRALAAREPAPRAALQALREIAPYLRRP